MNTDLDIYRARDKQAQDRIDADLGAGRAPAREDLIRLELNLGLVEAILSKESEPGTVKA